MGRLKIGVLVDNLGLGVRGGIDKAAELGLDGVQVYCTSGEMHPDSLSGGGRREFRKLLESKGLALSALCADFGRGLKNPDANNEVVPATAKCLELAQELGTPVVTTHFGAVSEDPDDAGRRAMAEALRDLERAAARNDVYLASETGAEPPERLRDFLGPLDLPHVKVNFDPANLTMRGWSAVEGVSVLAPWIVHCHAKDGRAGKGEFPIGEGEVAWPEYLAALEAVGYHGFHAIEREGGKSVVEDVARAAEFLRRL